MRWSVCGVVLTVARASNRRQLHVRNLLGIDLQASLQHSQLFQLGVQGGLGEPLGCLID